MAALDGARDTAAEASSTPTKVSADFTAEGSPAPGKVAGTVPATLPPPSADAVTPPSNPPEAMTAGDSAALSMQTQAEQLQGLVAAVLFNSGKALEIGHKTPCRRRWV